MKWSADRRRRLLVSHLEEDSTILYGFLPACSTSNGWLNRSDSNSSSPRSQQISENTVGCRFTIFFNEVEISPPRGVRRLPGERPPCDKILEGGAKLLRSAGSHNPHIPKGAQKSNEPLSPVKWSWIGGSAPQMQKQCHGGLILEPALGRATGGWGNEPRLY